MNSEINEVTPKKDLLSGQRIFTLSIFSLIFFTVTFFARDDKDFAYFLYLNVGTFFGFLVLILGRLIKKYNNNTSQIYRLLVYSYKILSNILLIYWLPLGTVNKGIEQSFIIE